MNQKIAHDSTHHDTDRTSVVITRRVRSGCEAAYEALLHGLLEDTKGFSGFQGGQVLRPKGPHPLEYQVTLHFENGQAKERWARSEERRRWVDGMKELANAAKYNWVNRILSVVKGKCPKCEKGDVFKSRGNILMLRAPVMHEECPHCHHHFEKEPGYFLGAMYVSYAMTLAESVAIYILVHNFTTSLELILTIIFAVVVLMSFINFRYSRMIWMYMFTQKESPQG